MTTKILSPTLLLLALIITGACNKVGIHELESIVDDKLVLFAKTEIPGELKDLVEVKRILILGETHYVQEHHEYISLLLDQYGPEGLCFINEFSNAHNWMIEDYIRGEIDHLPYSLRLLNHLWIEKIREINLASGPPYPIEFCFMDVNHWKDDFKNSIIESEIINGEQSIFAHIKILKADTDGYLRALYSLQELLEGESETCINTWGEKWYERYKTMVDLELESCLYRLSPDEERREMVMLRIVQSRLVPTPGLRAFINGGIYHAQKESLMGSNIKRLRALLEETYPDNICSLAFIGISGLRKYKFDDPEPISFDILKTAKQNDLIRIMGEKAGTYMSLLNLEDAIFDEEIDVTYTAGALRVAPGRQFDALISYPGITILESLSDFSY